MLYSTWNCTHLKPFIQEEDSPYPEVGDTWLLTTPVVTVRISPQTRPKSHSLGQWINKVSRPACAFNGHLCHRVSRKLVGVLLGLYCEESSSCPGPCVPFSERCYSPVCLCSSNSTSGKTQQTPRGKQGCCKYSDGGRPPRPDWDERNVARAGWRKMGPGGQSIN